MFLINYHWFVFVDRTKRTTATTTVTADSGSYHASTEST